MTTDSGINILALYHVNILALYRVKTEGLQDITGATVGSTIPEALQNVVIDLEVKGVMKVPSGRKEVQLSVEFSQVDLD